MKRKGISLFMVGWLIFLYIISGFTPVNAVEYSVSSDEKIVYECKFSTFAYDDPLNEEYDNPMNISMIEIDIVEANIGQNQEKTQAWGTLTVKLWYMELGKDWQLIDPSLIFIINSSNIDTIGNIGFEDGQITQDQIVSFFYDKPFLIPKPSSINDTDIWNAIKARLEGNLMVAYNYVDTYIATRDGSQFTVEGLGENKNYNLTVVYGEDGILEQYTLVTTEHPDHIVFQAQRLTQTIEVAEPTYDWADYLKQSIVVIIPLIAIIGMIVFLYRHKPQ